MIEQISKITLYVNNQEEAEKFWCEKLDFELRLKQPMGPDAFWVEVAPKGGQTSFVLYDKEMMHQHSPNTSTHHPSMILSTRDIMSTFQILSDKSVKVDPILDLPYGRMFTFYDQDGNAYMLRED